MAIIAGSEFVNLPSARPAGPIILSESVRVTVVLAPQRPLPPLLDIHRFTRQEFGKMYGADPAVVQKVVAFSTRFGLAFVEANAARRTVVLSGSLQQLGEAFGVTFQNWQADYVTYRGYTGGVSVPDDLVSSLVAVLGLDDRPIAVANDGARKRTQSSSSKLTPAKVGALYGFPTTVTGAGQTVGVIALEGGYDTDDLQAFFGQNVPDVVPVLLDAQANTPVQENTCDVEIVGAIAPDAKIVVYIAPNTVQGWFDAISTAVNDTVNQPNVITMSWAASEAAWSQSHVTAFGQALQTAAQVGVPFFVAAGDQDGEVFYPGSDPSVIGCGGTTLTVQGAAIKKESAWSETNGGFSALCPPPSWQTAAGVATGAGTGRGVPDVAGNVKMSGLVFGAKTLDFEGTSAVAPLWAGLIALVGSAIGGSVGFFAPALYANPTAFCRDIVSGNGATKGWDPRTGWGSPNGPGVMGVFQGTGTGPDPSGASKPAVGTKRRAKRASKRRR